MLQSSNRVCPANCNPVPRPEPITLNPKRFMKTTSVDLEGPAVQYEDIYIDWYIYMTTYSRQDIRLTPSNGTLTKHARILELELKRSPHLPSALDRQVWVDIITGNMTGYENSTEIS